MRVVKKHEIDSFFDLLAKSNTKLDEIKAKSNNAEISMKVRSLSDKNKAQSDASIELVRLKSVCEELFMRLQKQIISCTGIEPRIGESPANFLERLKAMSQAELVVAIRANGLVWED